MGFGEAINSCYKNYVTFSDRAPRSEYWYFFLFNSAVAIVAALIDSMNGSGWPFFGMFYWLSVIANILPGIAVTVRRLHDANHSGWWLWISFVPLVGAIVLLVWFCTRGTDGTNDFGSDPLEYEKAGPLKNFRADHSATEPVEARASPKPAIPPILNADIIAQLSRLAELRANGALTEEEFNILKAKFIGST